MTLSRPDTDHSESREHSREGVIAGAAGVVFFLWILTAAALFAVLMPLPAFSDSAEYHTTYFAEHGTALTAHAWLSGLFWCFCFLTFAAGLRRRLGRAGPVRTMWPDVAWAGAILAIAFGGIGLVFQTVAGSASAATSDIVPVLGRMLAVVDETLLYWGLGLFVAAASLAILQSGGLDRRFGWTGLAVALALVIGAAWPLTGDDRGLLGGLGLLGLFTVAIWILLVGVTLIRSANREPVPAQLAHASATHA